MCEKWKEEELSYYKLVCRTPHDSLHDEGGFHFFVAKLSEGLLILGGTCQVF